MLGCLHSWCSRALTPIPAWECATSALAIGVLGCGGVSCSPCRNTAGTPGPLVAAVQLWDSFLFFCRRGRELLSQGLISRRWLFLCRAQHVLCSQGDLRIKTVGTVCLVNKYKQGKHFLFTIFCTIPSEF